MFQVRDYYLMIAMRTIAITGGTGFVGRHLANALSKAGNKIIIFSRSPQKQPNEDLITYSYWDPMKSEIDIPQLSRINAVVNLAGTGIGDQKWTKKRKNAIFNSRVRGTSFLVQQLLENAPACNTFISASAIGFYGPDRAGVVPFKENAPAYNDFLAQTCLGWEKASELVAETMRRVIFRFGIVLGRDGGSFPRFAQPQSFGIVPILGTGKQAISWIHIDDLVSLLQMALNDDRWNGIYNAVAPAAISNAQLMKTIAKQKGGIKIPIHVPGALLKLALGELGAEVLKSCTVSAEKIIQNGFRHQYDTIDKAVEDILAR